MFRLVVRDHIMVAHSFTGEVFGPAQRLHGATFMVDLELARRELDANGIVADIGLLSELLRSVLAPLNYRNLDDLPQFKDMNTTTEFLAKYLFDQLAQAVRSGELGREPRDIAAIRVTISESRVARASYEASLQ